jgi:hypothetical protein
MKPISIITTFIFLFIGLTSVTAQKQESTFKVWGNCGMCKTTIEGAAKNSGATFASWNIESKMLTVKYNGKATSEDKIQKGIADAGYDNVKYEAKDEVYNKLHGCCQYDRKSETTSVSKEACCTKDGKCTGTMDCCKKMDGKADCCANGTCSQADGCCAKMDCKKGEGCCKKTGAVAMADCCKGKDAKCSH